MHSIVPRNTAEAILQKRLTEYTQSSHTFQFSTAKIKGKMQRFGFKEAGFDSAERDYRGLTMWIYTGSAVFTCSSLLHSFCGIEMDLINGYRKP